MSVALVHDFHAEACTVQHVGPGVQDAALTIKDGLVEVKPLRLKAMVDTPRAVNQMPTTGQAARKKWRLRLLLKEAYWKIRRPK